MQTDLSKPVHPDDAFQRLGGTPVDCHFHVFPAHVAVAGARYTPGYAAELDAWGPLARASGVARGLLVQPSFLGTDNSVLLAALARANQAPQGLALQGMALRGVAVVDPGIAAAELQGMHALGVRGIRLNLSGRSHAVDPWVAARGLWPVLEGLGWHLELHTDQGALAGVLAQLLPVLPPGLDMVLDHFAKPAAALASDPTVQAVQGMARAGRPVWIKLSASYRLGGPDALALARLWRAELGEKNLLWGSDWPCTNHEDLADYAQLHGQLATWLEDAQAVQQTLVDNPQRLLD